MVQWLDQIQPALANCARLAQTRPDAELEPALVAVGVLWPVAQPVQQFELEAIAAVQQVLGGNAKLVLRLVQSWDNADLLKAARRLRRELAHNPELARQINQLVAHFEADKIFGQYLAQAEAAAGPAATASGVDGPPTAPAQSRVFISYARSDGEQAAFNLRQRLEAEGIPVWQDRVKMVGGRDWWQQITEALNQVEFMLLLASRGALASEVVRKEWQYARQQGVCVFPIQVQPDLPDNIIPRWLRSAHFYNINQEWARLINDLNAACRAVRVPFMAESLPEGWVDRPRQVWQILTQLIDENQEPLAATVALHGAGGYGKTMLARAVCHTEVIRQVFDDGILWITLGENPGNITGRVIDLIEVLTGERPALTTADAAEKKLAELLANRNVLMVLDDAWQAAHLTPFLRGGNRCARLITTRNVSALPAQAHRLEIGPLERAEAVALLGAGLPGGPAKSLQELADRLGQWPLLLSLTNGALRDRVFNNNQPLSDALVYVHKALDKRGLTAFDTYNAAARDQAVSQTLDVSQELLSPAERTCYAQLAVFPAEVNIPLSTVQQLWATTANIEAAAAATLCDHFYRLSLLQFDESSRRLALPKILHDYLARQLGDQLPALHQCFLNAATARLPAPGWSQLPAAETYLWAYLAYHLLNANRAAELVATVMDLNYLAQKIFLRGAAAAETDLLAARRAAPDNVALVWLHRGVAQASHLLAAGDSLAQIAGTLHSRLAHAPLFPQITIAAPAPRPLITAAQRLPDLPSARLRRTLAGHTGAVLGCALSADGATAVSIDSNAQLKVWDTQTGAERAPLAGPPVVGNCCAISADGRVMVSATWDGALNIWEAATGSLRVSVAAHAAPIYACALSADGAVIVSASKDKTVKLWDGATGALRFTLTGHERAVTGCAISADGAVVASFSPDGVVKLWHGITGQLRASLPAFQLQDYNPVVNLTFTSVTSSLLTCGLSADGRTVVAVLPNGVLNVWEVATGALRGALKGHAGWVDSCAISADGGLIVSAGNDKSIKGWQPTGELLFTLEGHQRAATGCAISANGAVIVSASLDKSLKLWDTRLPLNQTEPDVYGAESRAVAVNAGRLAFATPENTLTVINRAAATPKLALSGHTRPVTGCALGEKIIVTAAQDQTLKIWNAATGAELFTLAGHGWAVNNCALSADGAWVVSAADDATLKIWDAATGVELRTLAGHSRGVNDCAISPDGAFVVSASADNALKVWNVADWRVRHTLYGHNGPVNGCAISPDSRLMASASADGTLKIWFSQNGAEQTTLAGHSTPVYDCAFHPAGRYLLSAGKDGTLRLWELESGQCRAALRVEGALYRCEWYPDGQHVLAAGARGVYFLQVIW